MNWKTKRFFMFLLLNSQNNVCACMCVCINVCVREGERERERERETIEYMQLLASEIEVKLSYVYQCKGQDCWYVGYYIFVQ